MARGRPTSVELRSNRATRRPARPSRLAVISPTGPAPTIATSHSHVGAAFVAENSIGGSSRKIDVAHLRHIDYLVNMKCSSATKFFMACVKEAENGQGRPETARGNRPRAARTDPGAAHRGRPAPLYDPALFFGHRRRGDEAGGA